MAKRGQNEGSIYKRSDGRWAGAISLGYQNGKPQRKTLYGKTRKEVQDKLVAELRKLQKGVPIVTERHTLKDFLKRWLEDCVKPSVRPKTFISYSDNVRLHIVPKIGNIYLTKVTPHHIQNLMNELLEAGLSPRTVSYQRTIIRSALNQALKWGLVERNVAALVDPPRVVNKEIQPINPEEARGLLEAIKGDRLEALFSVALAIGLRRGEALGLRWQDIDFEERTLRVSTTIQRLQGKLQASEVKTKGSRRVLDLPQSLAVKLKEHRARQLEERLLAGSKWQDTGLVFTTSIGTPLDPRNVKRKFDALLKRAGLPHHRIHDLRHFCASLLLAQRVPLKVVSDILGHSKIGITADLYTHVLPSLRRDAFDLMDSILTGS